MTKAEEAALKAYPKFLEYYPLVPSSTCGPDGFTQTVKDHNAFGRLLFQEGYEAAEKDTIERAIAWLKENANKYIVDIGVGYGEHGRNVELVVGGMCWEHLQQELEAKK